MDPYNHLYHTHATHGWRPAQPAPQLPPAVRQPPPSHPQQHMLPVEPQRPRYDMAPFQELSGAIARALEKYELYTASRFNQIDTALKNLTKHSADIMESVKTLHQESVTKDHFERACKESQDDLNTIRAIVRQGTAASLTKIERLENLVGNPDALHTNEKPSVLGRMGRLECAMMELTESVSDPDAARPPVIRHEAAVNTSPILHPTADVGTDVLDLLPPIQLVESGVQADIRESPLSVLMATHTTPEETPFTTACTVQTLVPASWNRTDDDTDSLVSGSSRMATSPLLTAIPPAFCSVEPSSSTGHLRRDASILDEQEIIDALAAGSDDRTRHSLSSSPDVASTHNRPLTPVSSRPASLKTPAHSTPTQIPPPCEPPLHRGFGRPSMTAPHPVSSLRALSNFSSPLSSPPIIPAETPTPRQSVPPSGRVSSPSLSTMSSLSSLDSETYCQPVQQNMSANTSRAANAPMKIKSERTVSDRPAKRRKIPASTSTFCNLDRVSYESNKGGNGRGRGSGRGRGGSASRGGRPRKNQLVITPVKMEKLQPQPSSGGGAAERARYEPPRIGTDCPWPAKVADESHREFVQCDE
ncbi:hypothetical protein C8Q80DRAFT_225687 [Daedaleopsis nitida]|nr:hypothetical protein C8Q80DRAFT_225687 [Daedaleopsis nitida]